MECIREVQRQKFEMHEYTSWFSWQGELRRTGREADGVGKHGLNMELGVFLGGSGQQSLPMLKGQVN